MVQPTVTDKPWGDFEQFVLNTQCTVKFLNVNPGEELSLQYHHKREEYWRIVSGSATIIIDDKEIIGKEGDEFTIPKMAKHRIRTTDSHVKILEIATGEFDEEDIVRLEDKYNRVR